MSSQKEDIFIQATELMDQLGFSIIKSDKDRPWGGFLVIDETQAIDFANHFFPNIDLSEIKITEKLSPKILLVAPKARLSWQYHHRRAEIWKCLSDSVGVVTSHDDTERKEHNLLQGNVIRLPQGERHRLIGLDDWGFVAEIWQHTDADNPSNEDDIVRVQDDFGR